MALGAGEEADDEDDAQGTGKGVRKTIQKPVAPSKNRNTEVKGGVCKCQQQEHHIKT